LYLQVGCRPLNISSGRFVGDRRGDKSFVKKEVVIPRLGSSDESDEVKILRWLKKSGDLVNKGEPLLEVETDKVNVEIEAPDSGCLTEIRIAEGQMVRFNSVVAILERED
jgi:pyruvate dehydrogenase E2 component (dihydrolipoamide acetyltransferase)